MPHLDANALESDPKGMDFLRDVIGNPSARTGSWKAAPKACVTLRRPITRRRRVATDIFRLLGFRACASNNRQIALGVRKVLGAALGLAVDERQLDWLPRRLRSLYLQKLSSPQTLFESGG